MSATTPNAIVYPTPSHKVRRALAGLFAPIFCAAIADIAIENPIAGSIANPLILLHIPYPADAAMPIEFTIVNINRKERLTIKPRIKIGIQILAYLHARSQYI